MNTKRTFINKRLIHRFSLLKTWESGIVLSGEAVKMIIKNEFDLSTAYVFINKKEEMFVTNFRLSDKDNNISKSVHQFKLLLHKNEITTIKKRQVERGLTIIVTKLYWKQNKIKLQIALAKGLKKHLKKQQIIAKDLKKQNRSLGKILDV